MLGEEESGDADTVVFNMRDKRWGARGLGFGLQW
jgi:hypothetical protein